ncbi:MAG: hypothetical protein KGL12_11900 [Rhodospirillales bacterium]|nr:hypothetical protein [Rhodospirillales bacterium]
MVPASCGHGHPGQATKLAKYTPIRIIQGMNWDNNALRRRKMPQDHQYWSDFSYARLDFPGPGRLFLAIGGMLAAFLTVLSAPAAAEPPNPPAHAPAPHQTVHHETVHHETVHHETFHHGAVHATPQPRVALHRPPVRHTVAPHVAAYHAPPRRLSVHRAVLHHPPAHSAARHVVRRVSLPPPRHGAPWLGERGEATYYAASHRGQRMATGLRYDPSALTAAHSWLPFGTRVRVRLVGTDRSVVVVITDRPGSTHSVIDLSYAAARALGILGRGTAEVSLSPG